MDFSALIGMLAAHPELVGGGSWGMIMLLGLSFLSQASKKKGKKKR